jgi:mRNA-degrading endonuclease toxin of MazEF toxin-antitoxin module
VLRGEVWRYDPVVARAGASTLRLVISDDSLNLAPDQRLAVGVRIVDEDPGELLAVRTSFGWAAAMTIEVIIRRRLVERLGALDADELAAVDVALRTVTGL